MNTILRTIRSYYAAGILAVLLLSASVAHAQSNIQTFLEIGSIKGESVVEKHKDEIEALAFNSGVQTPLEPGTGGGGASKPQFFEVQISKKIDRASPALFVNCAIGKIFPTAVISVAKITEKGVVDFFKITLNNVAITRVETSGTDGKTGALTETIALSFSKIRWTYTLIDPKGGAPTTFTGGYDLATDTPL